MRGVGKSVLVFRVLHRILERPIYIFFSNCPRLGLFWYFVNRIKRVKSNSVVILPSHPQLSRHGEAHFHFSLAILSDLFKSLKQK